jgi:peroxiredoxin
MFHVRRSWIAVIAAGLAMSCMGCPSQPPAKPAGAKSNSRIDKDFSAKPAKETRHEPEARKPKPEEPPPPPTIPKVKLSGELHANCLVKVGDSLPKVELPDQANKTHLLDSLYGKKLTVVCIWTGASRRAQLEAAETLNSLTSEIANPFQKNGVQVIGIEVARNDVDMDGRQRLREAVAKLPFPCLVDSKGRFLASLSKDDKLPRVYLLDAKGKILWFDVEFSRFTREELVQGIRAALGERN